MVSMIVGSVVAGSEMLNLLILIYTNSSNYRILLSIENNYLGLNKLPIIGVSVNLATAVIGVKPFIVFSLLHFQVCLSQSQSLEWP